MDPSHLDELVRLEDRYWWQIAKRRLVTPLVEKYLPAPERIVAGALLCPWSES